MGCVGGCLSCIGNIIYYLVNLIFMVVGIGCLCAGTILIVSFDCTIEKLLYQFFTAIGIPSPEETLTSTSLDVSVSTTAIVILSVGGGLVVLSLFAFLGSALKGLEKIVVFIYIILAFAILGVFIFAIVFFALDEKPEDVDFVKWTLKEVLKKYKPTTGKTDDFTIEGALMDTVQSYFHCCGVYGVDDFAKGGIASQVSQTAWDMTLWGGSTSQNIRVPPTCCRTFAEQLVNVNDTMDANPSMSIADFPTPKNINVTQCYSDPVPSPSMVHTARPCPATIYKVADGYQTAILITASVGTAVFFFVIIGLFVKLCSKKANESKH